MFFCFLLGKDVVKKNQTALPTTKSCEKIIMGVFEISRNTSLIHFRRTLTVGGIYGVNRFIWIIRMLGLIFVWNEDDERRLGKCSG